ncbi:DeoR/GlpR family DNA-binding transcription regulator [Fusobacterium sp.]|uniref:DeoR/GlpR family DNA-binding transcription regulator n=1 Tax=Fusobacterium sp. TaxID=68766 RepID=UPI002611F100|nr:DeoR/GlpR family DNA-binding transcription regulator [Fusobacterium sp.]
MLAIQRLKEIENILNEKGSVVISSLSKQFKVSEETIRRDLDKLEKTKVLKRVRGGAYLQSESDKQVPLEIREKIYLTEKQEIADKCIEFIEDGDTIMIDSSTTAVCVAQNIHKYQKKVTVITNSLKVVEEFQDSKWVKVICVGGGLRKRTKSFIGNQALNQLDSLHANKAFISCTAVNKKFGATDDSERESEIRKKMISNSEKFFLIVDGTKFDNLESHLICKLDEIDVIVTEEKLSEEWEEIFEKAKVEIKYV